MFCIKICSFQPELVRAKLLWLEPEPIYLTWSRKKIFGVGAEGKWLGSATLQKVLN